MSVVRESLSISLRRLGDFMARFCYPSGNVFENKMTSFQQLLTLIMDHKLKCVQRKLDITGNCIIT